MMTKHKRLNKIGYGIAKVVAAIGGFIAGASVGGVAFPLYGIISRGKKIEKEIEADLAFSDKHSQGGMTRARAIERNGSPYCPPPHMVIVMTAIGPVVGAALGAALAMELVDEREGKQIKQYKDNQAIKKDHHHGFFAVTD